MDNRATGTFSFTLSAEWDYVPNYNRESYLNNQYAIPLDERLDMRRVVDMLLKSGNWVPYDAVRSVTIEKYLDTTQPSHKPLFSEYLYFNSHMRRLIYNQRDFSKKSFPDADGLPGKNVQTAKNENGGDSAQGAADVAPVEEPKASDSENYLKACGKYAKAVGINGDPMVVLHHRHFDENASYHLFRYREYSNKKTAELIEYILPISSVELRLYAVGVMLLTIRCQNEDPANSNTLYHYHIHKLKDGGSEVEWPTKGQPVEVTDPEHLAWIESCGRRLFSARMCPPGCFASMAGEYPVLSYLRPGTTQEDKAGSEIIICDFRSLHRSQKQPQGYRPLVDVDMNLLLSDEKKKEIWQLQAEWSAHDLDKPLEEAFGSESGEATQPERLGFLSQLVGPFCISKTSLNDSSASEPANPKERKLPAEALLVLDCFNDDRMYLHGSVVSERIYQKTKRGWDMRHQENGYLGLKDWYAILYADHDWNNPTLQDPQTLVSLIEQATDARWYVDGTLHGMTYHSMVMLNPNVPPDYLQANNDWHYLQMFLIAVLQRCGIQRFYREASGLLRTNPWLSNTLRNAVQNKYTLFLNQFWFFEVTEQEQGKALFSRLQQAMNIERDVEFLDSALEEINQQNTNKLGNMVNKLLLPLSIIGGLWAVLEMGKSFYPAEQPGLFQQVMGVLSSPPVQQPVFTLNDFLNYAFLAAMLVCLVIYLVNQAIYIRQTCTGMIMDLKRRAKKLCSFVCPRISRKRRREHKNNR